MVVLNRIYTRSGDAGTSGLSDGNRRPKHDIRFEALGAVDEANAAVGLARLHTKEAATLDAMLARLQNDLFDLGADLATPTQEDASRPALRIVQAQVDRLETEIDSLNADLEPLRSFVLPGGHPAAAGLHLARTVVRRAERTMTALATAEPVGDPALRYINRASDFLFVAARWINRDAGGDVLWVPGATR